MAAAKKTKVKIAGTGTMPLYSNGDFRRVPKGKAIAVSKAELDFMTYAGVKFTKEK